MVMKYCIYNFENTPCIILQCLTCRQHNLHIQLFRLFANANCAPPRGFVFDANPCPHVLPSRVRTSRIAISKICRYADCTELSILRPKSNSPETIT